jgi:diguanylate cyclase (GGDEF)-like protein
MAMNEKTEISSELETKIQREQVRLAVQQLPVMQIVSFIVALVLSYSVWNIIPLANIVTWIILVLSVVVSRFVMYIRFLEVRDDSFDGEVWKNAYLLLAFFSGVIWGVSAFIIFPAHHDGRMFFFVLVIASMASTTTISHASFRLGAAAWAGPAMLLYVVSILLAGRETAYTIGFHAALYLVTILYYSIEHNNSIRSSISLKFENLDLLEAVRKTNEILRLASTMDALTGLANRYNFDEFMDREWRRAVRDKKPLSLIMLDIDHFKAFNDTYGHQAGDDCLKKVSAVIAESAKRPADLAARYGGEEFVVVLPDTDVEGAAEMAEKIRRDVESLGVLHEQSPTAAQVTVSVGVASVVPDRDAASSDLLRRVDMALYAAKNSGRNRVKYS